MTCASRSRIWPSSRARSIQARMALLACSVCSLYFFATLAYGAFAVADDIALPETAPPPPPSLAPETPPQEAPAAPAATTETTQSPAKSDEASKAPSETPEPTPTPKLDAAEPLPNTADQPDVAGIPEPTPDQNTEDARQDNVIEAKKEGRIPFYQTTHPAWGFEVAASIGALGGNGTNIEASQGGALARALEMQFEYQLPFLQAIGVLSLGPSLAVYPIGSDGSVTNSPASIWGVGGQVRYQARFFREQIIVPMVGFEAQQFSYHFVDGNSGSTPITGQFLGAMFLLNVIEPAVAAENYIENDISRSYLVAEYKIFNGSDPNVSVSGGSFYFGFRLEF